jgi:uncharacterized protein
MSEARSSPSVSDVFMSYVEDQMQQFECGAHDASHMHRVADMALHIASKCEGSVNTQVVYVAALLHDMLDSKLVHEDEMEKREQDLRLLIDKEMKDNLTAVEVDLIFDIVKSVGYKNMIRDDWKPETMSVEYRCVQDADLLDAIGNIGVARCYAFGGKRKRALFTVVEEGNDKLTPEQYKASKGSGVEHFFDKLLRIKDMMTTNTGREIALSRHKRMCDYLIGIDEEIKETAGTNNKNEQSVLGKRLASFLV